jgi:hypothetical protein
LYALAVKKPLLGCGYPGGHLPVPDDDVAAEMYGIGDGVFRK